MASLSTTDWHRRFPPVPSSPREARRFVANALAAHDFHGNVDTVLLLASEVVSNAVRHAATAFDLIVHVEEREVTVTVVDQDPLNPPAVQEQRPDATHGRGMFIVDKMASEWGAERRAGGRKAVWFSCS